MAIPSVVIISNCPALSFSTCARVAVNRLEKGSVCSCLQASSSPKSLLEIKPHRVDLLIAQRRKSALGGLRHQAERRHREAAHYVCFVWRAPRPRTQRQRPAEPAPKRWLHPRPTTSEYV